MADDNFADKAVLSKSKVPPPLMLKTRPNFSNCSPCFSMASETASNTAPH